MNEFRESAKEPEDEAAVGGFDSPAPEYDPLFASWDEPTGAAASRAEDVDFLLAGSWPDRSQLFEHGGDALGWELPAMEPYGRGQREHDVPYWLPDPMQRLQEGTIALPRPGRHWAVTVRELVETALLAVLIFLAVRASFQNFQVEGQSMEPSLQDGQYLIVNKLSYAGVDTSIFNFLPFYEEEEDTTHHLWTTPSRGDIIVFRAPTQIERDFIKRIIGLPGDTVQINESTGQVTVNGNVLTEPYISGKTNCNANCTRIVPMANTPQSRADCGSNACYFVLGDNRQNSSDSRGGWLVPEENIIGKALVTYWNRGNLDVGLAPNHSVGISNNAAAEE